MELETFRSKCIDLRKTIIETAFTAQKGHVPSAFSLIEILVTLYYRVQNIDKSFSQNRNRIILSKGHGCLAQYAILADLNFFSKNELHSFCKFNGILGGHPSRKINGIEVSTGSLGHGPSLGVGMSLALRSENLESQVFVVVGDGECNEGSVWEAALSASKHQLDNFWIIVDSNKYQSYDLTQIVCPLDDLAQKWQSFGFQTKEIDMQKNSFVLFELIEEMKSLSGPKCIVCHTIKGMGAKSLEGNLAFHHIRSMSAELKMQLINEIETHA